MPTNYSDQFWLLDPFAPPPGGTALLVQNYSMVDFDDDNDLSGAGGDTVNGSDITAVYNGDTVTVQLSSGGIVTVTGVTFYLANGQRVFTPSDGSVLEDVTFLSSTWVSPDTQMDVADLGPPCFTPGTLIETETGMRPVEEIAEGDRIATRDSGLQPVVWISRRTVDATGVNAPICISEGALGNDRDLLVSPQHRMLIEGWRAELLFGEDEVFVAATHLLNSDLIYTSPAPTVDYIHLLLPRHEVIYAEGVPTESLDPGGDLARADPGIRERVLSATPELASRDAALPRTARPVAKGFEAGLLLN